MSALSAELKQTSSSDWEVVPLEDVAEIFNGGTPKSKVTEYWGGDVQWLTPAEMGKMSGRLISRTARTITAEGLARSSARLVPPDSVILSTRAPIGHLAINEAPMAFNQGCRGVVPGPQLDHVFLYYFLLHSREKLDALGTGTTFKELAASRLRSFQIPLPPLPVQRRVVAMLDQAFAALDRAKLLLGESMVDGSALDSAALERILYRDSKEGDLKTLGELCRFENGDRGRNYPGRKAFVAEGVPFINAGHLGEGRVLWEKMDYIPEGRFNLLSRGKVQKDDLLFCLRGSLGKFAKVERDTLGAIASSLVIVRPGDWLLPDFLVLYFKSALCAQMIGKYAGGAAQPNLSAGDLKKFEIRLPSLSRQKSAVREYKLVSSAISTIRQRYAERGALLVELRKAVLEQAFSGQLT